MRAPSFYSDPHVQFLSQLLEEIGGGLIQVPRFQRPLVWKWERRRELLRSIRDGIPMGAIMVWRTSSTKIECYAHLGPHRLVTPNIETTRSYLLDGVQRLSTLYGALHRPNRENDASPDETVELAFELEDADDLNDSRDFQVFVDLQTKDFFTPASDDVTGMMPLSIVFDSIALLKFQRELAAQNHDEFIKASDDVVRAFRDYKVPIIPITTDDIDMATRTFQKINSQGAKMSEAHMVHALTWSNRFDLQNQLGDLRQKELYDVGWSDLDDDPILKSIKAAFGLDVYKTSAEDLSERLKKEPSMVASVLRAMRLAAEFLRTECGVPSPDLVPYSLQIVILTEAFMKEPNPDSILRTLLRQWFWMTTYGELFAGMTGDRTGVALDDMREMIAQSVPLWTWRRPYKEGTLARTFDFRAARTKAFVYRLADQQNAVLRDHSGWNVLADAGRRGAVPLLQSPIIPRTVFSSPANRFLIHPAVVSEFRERLLNRDLTASEMEAHFIEPETVDDLRSGNGQRFVQRRLEVISAVEHQFASEAFAPFIMTSNHPQHSML